MKTTIHFGFKGKDQLPLFMVWREYRNDRGEVAFAEIIFDTSMIMDWLGHKTNFVLDRLSLLIPVGFLLTLLTCAMGIYGLFVWIPLFVYAGFYMKWSYQQDELQALQELYDTGEEDVVWIERSKRHA
jgi:hypothetical protein